ncbi:hypothetical protein A3H75_01995 [Candidatus Uhrbacteria bacterium RIFCSPLOWO2_02_FULL_51_9]|uniref:DUF4190 domain-containing protein n=1 Tax=Candidatus Uhrbacteria bacterium RIFCSPLOWO2_02_FULL_51_9 TaxID=1802410 RepID=A0A1F7VFI1_9BACT|nr:MAG: hypothetical protein A3H75_01995 [Candidatus Uhrbacteria bacterium RIFCSPLOWO2_02_FULL_51_9]
MNGKKFAILFSTAVLLLAPQVASAAILPDCAKEPGGCAQLSQLIQVGVNYGRFILGISGALALVFFIWGGFLILTSAGVSDRVKKGKEALRAATIGLIIIFGAFTAVKFILRMVDPTGTYDQYVLQPTKEPARE